jgi:hypothetical protein
VRANHLRELVFLLERGNLAWLVQVHPKLAELSADSGLKIRLIAAYEAEMDAQWSYVGYKSNQRWLWYAVDHTSNTVLADMFGKRQDEVLQTLKIRLEP